LTLPLVGQLNDIEVLITTEPNNRLTGNAFANITMSIQKGGSPKELAFLLGEEIAEHYLAQIFPSKTGAHTP
jgi:hypothetical protein